MGNNPKLDHVNVDAIQNLVRSHSQNKEQKRNFHGMTEPPNHGITEG